MALVVEFESPIARIATHGQLVVSYFRNASTLPVLRELERIQDRVIAQHGIQLGMSILGEMASAFQMDEELRKETVALSAKYINTTGGTAIVILQKGLKSIAVRTFLTGYFLVSKTTNTTKTFGSVGEGLEWLKTLPVNQSLGSLTTAEIEQFIAKPLPANS